MTSMMSQANADSPQQTATAEADAPTIDSNHETTTTTPEVGNQTEGGSGEADLQESTPTLDERIANVTDPADFEAMMAEVQQNPNSFANPNEDQQPDNQQAQGEDQPPPEGEVEQEESANEEAEQSEVDEIEEGEADESEEEEEEESHPRFRLRPSDKVDAEAMRIKKAAEAAGTALNLSEALELAKRNLGVEENPNTYTEDSEESEYEEHEEDPTQGVTFAEAKADLKDLRKKASQALREGDLDEAADFNDQISDTEELIEEIIERDERDSYTQRHEHDTAFESSVSRAYELYPDFGNEDSEFFERCSEIDESLKDTDDPRYFDANKPLLIAKMAAAELNVAPKRKGSKSTKTATAKAANTAAQPQQQSTSPQPPRTEKPGQLPAASGASRTSGAPTGAAASLAEQVGNINNPEDFERLAKAVHRETR
ncbi:hypothetical protein OAG69_00215 [bacterium]|nr:hypothetical protein [bacterium]